eukprot:4028772-Pyramimonas_sp.AAC.1
MGQGGSEQAELADAVALRAEAAVGGGPRPHAGHDGHPHGGGADAGDGGRAREGHARRAAPHGRPA